MSIRLEPPSPSILDWLAQLRDDGPQPPEKAAGRGPDVAVPAPQPRQVVQQGRPAVARRRMPADSAEITERAVIGDQLRLPIALYEMGRCIARHTDPAALGEAHIRALAIAAGWRIDAFRRLACPRCQQTDPCFRSTQLMTRWDRASAIAKAALVAAAAAGAGGADETITIGVVEGAAAPGGGKRPRGRHRSRYGPSRLG